MNDVVIRALGANPGSARGALVSSQESVKSALESQAAPFILVRPDLGPEDASLLGSAAAVILTRSGLTGDGAIMARALGKPCVVSASMIRLRSGRLSVLLERDGAPATAVEFDEGVLGSIDGRTGEIRFVEAGSSEVGQ